MEFSQKEEATYDLLVNTKVGEIKQLKYEMCRPKKKGKTVLKKCTVEEEDHKEEKQDIPAYAIPKPRVQNYALPRDHSQPLPLPQETNSELYSVPYEDEAAVQQLNSLTFNNPRPIRDAPLSKKCSFFEHCSKGL